MNKIKKHLASYKYSVRGILVAFKGDQNMFFHLIAAIAVVITNCLLKISRTEWLITIILISLALMAELFNTAIEKLADCVTREQDPLIAQVKDIASGAVLIICGGAVVCALIIYLPYIL
ncbi:diacylglycerol kinase family protein [Mucilaginibacter sp. CAU 1740]|uniref:diacylglycerol kinase family protein n=1 Tax=Mucilaginibacter sp. CAU 1740 TaxID=3140365 RepID=UPI00325B6110